MTDNELLLAISDIMEKKLDARIQPIESDIKTIRDDIIGLRQNVREIELHLENTTDKNIQLLSENYVPAAKRYEKATAKIEAMQTDIDIMKSVVKEHSAKLQKIS